LLPVEDQVVGNLYPETIFLMAKCRMKQWKNFESDNADDYNAEFEDGLDEDDLDMFEGDDSFETMVLKKRISPLPTPPKEGSTTHKK
jgi:hypothetical protein